MTPELAYIVNFGREEAVSMGITSFDVDDRREAILAVYVGSSVNDGYMGLLEL